MPQLKRWHWVIGIIALVFIMLYLMVKGSYNSLVEGDQKVQQAFAQVDVQYQRRADLIPQLVEAVRGIADQEEDVLVGVTEARASATQVKVEDLGDAQKLQEYADKQGELSSALSRLMVTVEAYPQIASQQNFLNLQAQIEGTENRIAVARSDYNAEVTVWNTKVNKFPTMFWASLFGFDDYERFQADEGAEDRPDFELED